MNEPQGDAHLYYFIINMLDNEAKVNLYLFAL